MYWESPEKAQSHIQPLEVSPGLLLLMLSSVISEKLDVLQILQVWSAEQVASSLRVRDEKKARSQKFLYLPPTAAVAPKHLNARSRGVWAEFAAQGVALVCWDLSFGNELSHFISHPSSQVPHVTVSLSRRTIQPIKSDILSFLSEMFCAFPLTELLTAAM